MLLSVRLPNFEAELWWRAVIDLYFVRIEGLFLLPFNSDINSLCLSIFLYSTVLKWKSFTLYLLFVYIILFNLVVRE